MGGEGASAEEAQLKGLSKHFNSVTINGRANVAKLTYAVCAGIGLLIWSRPKKPTAATPPASPACTPPPPAPSKTPIEPKIPAGSRPPDNDNECQYCSK